MLSLARETGKVRIDGHQYTIVNKEGRNIYELSVEAEREGRDVVIEAGEPADLCRLDMTDAYRKLGRRRILTLIKKGFDADTIKRIADLKKWV